MQDILQNMALEEFFEKKGRVVNSEGETVRPKRIWPKPRMIYYSHKEEEFREKLEKKSPRNATGFIRGEHYEQGGHPTDVLTHSLMTLQPVIYIRTKSQ